MADNLRPCDELPKVGDRVWWTDPDEGISSGWWRVVYAPEHGDDVVGLVNDAGSELEALPYELRREEA